MAALATPSTTTKEKHLINFLHLTVHLLSKRKEINFGMLFWKICTKRYGKI